MSTQVQSEDWRRKYFDSIRAIEQEARQFRDLETMLRRLVGRLCVVAQGQAPRLDDELRQLGEAARSNADIQALEVLSQRLIAAVNEADQLPRTTSASTPPPVAAGCGGEMPAEAIFGDERVRAVLARLLAGLRRDPELLMAISALEEQLATSLTREQLPRVLEEIAALVGRRVQNIERVRQELEALLAQMLARLDDIGSYVAGQSADQAQQVESTETLNTQLAGEVRAIGESVESGDDLALIRRQLRMRLDSIDRHLQEYRDREAQRAQTTRERNEQMRQRMEELEGEARKLHAQLHDEQRLSMLDNLTQVANRLAFEARFAEEIERFRRFGQPTCVAIWDIDRFKVINDTYGHRAGDKVLKLVAQTLAAGIRSTDFIARYGGEEFVMLLPGTAIEDARRVMDTLRTAVSDLGLHFRGVPVTITVSCGLTQLRADDSAADAFDRADKALYAAKDSGRNCCCTGG
ncbi:MAG: diguanylate cyclase [Steroidobacteraceae bacterium]